MNAPLTATRDTRVEPQRALMARAFVAMIEMTLAPGCAPRDGESLLNQITRSGMGLLTTDGTAMTLVLLNIRASVNAPLSCNAVLRKWQQAALDKISGTIGAC